MGPIRWIAAGLCAWEVAAITTGKMPTLTQISAEHPVIGLLLVGALAIHLHKAPNRYPLR